MRKTSFFSAFLPVSSLAVALVAVGGCGPSASSRDVDGGLGSRLDASSESIDAAEGRGTDASAVDASALDAAPFAPDAEVGPASGSYIYYFGDFLTANLNQVGRMDLGSRERTVLPLSGFSGGAEITAVAVNPSVSRIAVAGKNNTEDPPKLQSYSENGTGAPISLFVAPDSQRRVSAVSFSPDGVWLAFLADGELLGARALYVVRADGSSAAQRVSLPPVSSTQDVSTYRWARDSLHLAFEGDLVSPNVEALWTVDITGNPLAPVEIVTTAELGNFDVQRGLAFDSSDRLYFRSNFELGSGSRLYRVNLDGSARAVVPGTHLTNGAGEASVGSFAISADGLLIAWAVESPSENLYQVQVLTLATATSIVVSALSLLAPSSGNSGPNLFEGMRFSPDGSKLVMAADWLVAGSSDNDFGVVVLPSEGPATGVRLAIPAVGSGDAFRPRFSADSNEVIFIGDMLVSAHNDLFVTNNLTAMDQDLTALRVVQSNSSGSIKGIAVTR